MKVREALLSAVQIYNNPLISFKTESFIVLSLIAWTYLLHAHYRKKGIDYRYYIKIGKRKKYDKNPDGSIKYWDLKECISKADFDNKLSEAEIKSDRFAYRLLFAKVLAKRKGQADCVIEFIDPKSKLAKNITKEYWIKEETEKQKFSPTLVIQKVRDAGFKDFGMHQHTRFWQKHDGKNQNKGFGTMVVKTWYWYQNWIDYIIKELGKK